VTNSTVVSAVKHLERLSVDFFINEQLDHAHYEEDSRLGFR
jgi:hypothetical protein